MVHPVPHLKPCFGWRPLFFPSPVPDPSSKYLIKKINGGKVSTSNRVLFVQQVCKADDHRQQYPQGPVVAEKLTSVKN